MAQNILITFAQIIASLSVLIVYGQVLFPLALVAAVFGVAGNFIGAKYFTKKGTDFIKLLIIIVLSIFFVKLCWELFVSN